MPELTELTASIKFGNVTDGDYTEVETNGTQQAKGDATCWDDLVNSLVGRRLASSSGVVDYDYAENAISFGANGDVTDINDTVVFNLQKPHAAKTDSVAMLHMHWEQVDSTDREFTVRYRIQNNNAAKTTAWTTVAVGTNANNVFTYTSGTLNQITKLVEIDWSAVSISSTVQIQMTRSDAVAGTINVVFVDAHVEYDMLGSREEFVK